MLEFEKLEVYRKAIEFSNSVYEITKEFPQHEQFGIVSQLRRAALSVALNLAEGAGRFNKKEKRHFYRMARASAYECFPLLEVSLLQKYINADIYTSERTKCIKLTRLATGMIKSQNI